MDKGFIDGNKNHVVTYSPGQIELVFMKCYFGNASRSIGRQEEQFQSAVRHWRGKRV